MAQPDESATARRVLVVVNDLLVYRAATSRPTGIQRLAEGYATHLPEAGAASGVEVLPVVVTEGGFRSVQLGSGRRSRSAALAERALATSAILPRWLQEGARTLGRRVLARRAAGSGRPVETRPGDVALVLGAPWISPGMAASLVEARSRGEVRLAQLVHDLLPLTDARWFSDAQGTAAASDLRMLLMHADVLAADSVEVARDASAVTGQRVAAILPPDPVLPSPADPRGLVPTEPYILTVGTLHPRKNHVLLLDVWRAWIEADGPDLVPLLVIAGRRHPQDGPLFERLAADAIVRSRVRVVADASDAELAALLIGCRFLVFPSLAEGWGLPVREALAYGKPSIVTHAIPSAGSDGWVERVPTGEAVPLVDAVRRWWSDPSEVDRRSVAIRDGFVPRTWEAAARDLLGAILSW
jgi:glycosyltransferase involved in cell wall biosynthesis